MTLGSNIQKIRKENQLSQEKFAEMFQVTRQTVSNWEREKSYPDLQTLILISDSFHVSLDVLLKEDMVMVKTIDNEVKSTRKYAKLLTVFAAVFALLIGSFGVYSAVYLHTKRKLEDNFQEQLKENEFYRNKSGYYSMKYKDNVTFGIPNQSMPGILDFTLHFHAEYLYCDIELEDRVIELQWIGQNDVFGSAVSKTEDKVIGSTEQLEEGEMADMKKLGEELGIPEDEIREIMESGNQLYQEFYLVE